MKTMHKIFWLFIIGVIGFFAFKCWYEFIFVQYESLFPALVFSALTMICIALWKDIK